VSLDFFKAYLRADHVQLAARLAPAATAAAEPVPVPPVAAPSTSAVPVTAASAVTPAARLRPAALATAGTPAPAATLAPLALRITAAHNAHHFARGSAVQLTIRPSREAHVYCFLQDENHRIMRFFPNRFQRDSRVPPDGLQLPGAMRFEIVMNQRGLQETVACFATERDVLASLPATVNPGDFETLPVANLDQVRSAFAAVAGGALSQQSFPLQAR